MDTPNILLLMTDQHRRDHVGLYGDNVATPNLDALGRRGVTFGHACSPIPLCVPARCGLMTGRSASSLGRDGGFFDNVTWLSPDDATLAGTCRAAGYRLGMVGKNHAFTAEELRRWDAVESYAFHGKEADVSRTPPTAADERVRQWRQANVPYFEAAVHEPQPGDLADDPAVRQTDDALAFLAAADDRPFFLYLSYEAPHFPYVLPEPLFSQADPDAVDDVETFVDAVPTRLLAQRAGLNLDQATPADLRRVVATYRGMIRLVDEQIGRVLDGLPPDTLILFCSDHGDYLGDRGLIGKSVTLHESLLQIPMLLAGPGVPAGVRHRAHVDLTDVAPTLLDLAGLPPLPEATGRSVAPILGDPDATHRRLVVAERSFGRDEGMPPDEIRRVVADRERLRAEHGEAWFLDALRGRCESVYDPATGLKLIRHDADADELYDLRTDPAERRNLAGDRSNDLAVMNALLDGTDFAAPDVW